MAETSRLVEVTRLRAEASADQEARRTAVQSRVTDFTAGIEAHYLEFLRLCREMEEATRRWTVVDRADWENPITIIRAGADGEIDVELHTGLPGESQEEGTVESCMVIRTTFEKLLNGTRDLKPEDYDRMIALVESAKQRSTTAPKDDFQDRQIRAFLGMIAERSQDDSHGTFRQ